MTAAMLINSDSEKTVENQAIIATDVTKSFGEGEAKTIAVNGVGLVAHFGEMLCAVSSYGSVVTHRTLGRRPHRVRAFTARKLAT